jgi:NAD-dependent SIR2 family protein deacetylase
MPSEYRRLCDPLRLTDETKTFQSFWMNFAQEYENRQPHLGYSIMEQWCKGKIQGLEAKAETGDNDISPWWIYSSNVDGHFHRFECFKNTVCEIHGRASEFRCSSAIGYNMKKKRSGVQWNKWNDNVKSNVECNCTILPAQYFFEHSQSLIMECMYCSLPMRPNVLMFHDTDENVLSDIEVQRNRYQEWEEHVETRVVEDGLNFVVLELGAGTNVPAVREESEEVFKDCLERIKGNPRSKGNVTLIRINPKDFSFRTVTSTGGSLISVPEKAAKALQCIDNFLTLLR